MQVRGELGWDCVQAALARLARAGIAMVMRAAPPGFPGAVLKVAQRSLQMSMMPRADLHRAIAGERLDVVAVDQPVAGASMSSEEERDDAVTVAR